MEWDLGLTLVPRPEDATYFRKDVSEKYVHYCSPPLPLLSMLPCQQGHKARVSACGVHLSAVSADPGRPHLLCVGHCCTISIYSCVKQSSGTDQLPGGLSHPLAEIVNVHESGEARLAHGARQEAGQEAMKGAGQYVGREAGLETYENWAGVYSELSCVCLSTLTLPRRETLVHLDACLVKERPFLGVATSGRFLLYELPVGPTSPEDHTHSVDHTHPTQHTQPVISAQWDAVPLINVQLSGIVMCTLSPYVAGQAVVCTSTGGVAIYNEDGSGGHVVSSSGNDDLGRVHVTFGSHPQHVLGLWRGSLHSIDLHSAVLPLCLEAWSVLVGREVYGKVLCVSVTPEQPFLLHLATPTHLVVADMRQPLEPLVFTRHLLHPTPHLLNITVTNELSVVLLGSVEANVVLTFSCSQTPVTLVGRGHVVCMPSDILVYLKRSELACIVGGTMRRRLATQGRQLLGPGTSLIGLCGGHFAAITLTEYGDVFCQCWRYSANISSNTRTDYLTACYFQGYKLWLNEQAQKLRQDTRLASVEASYPATVRDMTSIAKVVICTPENTSDGRSLSSLVRKCGENENTMECGHKEGGVCVGPVVLLQELCTHMPVTTALDEALLRVWGSYVPPVRLFGDDDDAAATDTQNKEEEEEKGSLSNSQEDFRDSSAVRTTCPLTPASNKDSPLPSTLSWDSPLPTSNTKDSKDTPTSASKATRRKIGF